MVTERQAQMGSSHEPVETWEEAHRLLLRLVEVFDRRSLFNDEIPREQAYLAMNAAIEADDELKELARRLQAGSEEFLSLRLLSPAEESLVHQERGAGGSEEPSQPRNLLGALKRLAEEVFGKGPRPLSAEEDLKVMRVQDFLTERKALGRSTPP